MNSEALAGGVHALRRDSYENSLRVLGRVAEILVLRRYMQRLLRERNAVLKAIAESADWQRFLP